MRIKKFVFITLILAGWIINMEACTIFSGKDKKGHVWVGNNEDMVFTFNTYLNMVMGSDSTFGYTFLTYYSPNGFIQGGVNEKGLFFDFNAIAPSEYKDYDKKKDFPGGHRAMLQYVLEKCKTVREVLNLFEKYRLPGLESGQMHLADKYGNLGIIVADSMWITKTNYQVSTNYNICHPDKDGVICWRYPIAERILKTREPSSETFREISDSTSQRSTISTIYSNIHDLTTGDIWFYYGLDYSKAFKTNIRDLLKKGNTSFLLYELFTDEPLVAVYKTYQSKGVEESLRKLNEYHIPKDRNNEILSLLSSDLILYNQDFNSYPFLSVLIKSKKETDEFLQAINAIALFCTNRKTEAIDGLNKYLIENPESDVVQDYLNQMKGIFDNDANVRFELTGSEKAKCVFVGGLTNPNIRYFLIRKEGKWIGEFRLPPGEYHYIFLVDGKRTPDPKNHDIVKDEGLDYNRIFVKN
jgi:hypothetical protein